MAFAQAAAESGGTPAAGIFFVNAEELRESVYVQAGAGDKSLKRLSHFLIRNR